MASNANPIFVAAGKGIRIGVLSGLKGVRIGWYSGLVVLSVAAGLGLTLATLNGNVLDRSIRTTCEYARGVWS
jgi:hypothetical protein